MAGGINYPHIWLREIIYGSWSRFKCCHWIWKGFFMFRESSISFFFRRVLPSFKGLEDSGIFSSRLDICEREAKNPRRAIKNGLPSFIFYCPHRNNFDGSSGSPLSQKQQQAKELFVASLSSSLFLPARFTMRVSRKRVCSWRRRVVKNCWFRAQTERSAEINRDI